MIYDRLVDVDWFLLPLSDQMDYKFLLHNAQEAKTLTIGGLYPLNMMTCVSVIETLFTPENIYEDECLI